MHGTATFRHVNRSGEEQVLTVSLTGESRLPAHIILSDPAQPGVELSQFDFGEVAVGRTVTRELQLENLGGFSTYVQITAGPPFGADGTGFSDGFTLDALDAASGLDKVRFLVPVRPAEVGQRRVTLRVEPTGGGANVPDPVESQLVVTGVVDPVMQLSTVGQVFQDAAAWSWTAQADPFTIVNTTDSWISVSISGTGDFVGVYPRSIPVIQAGEVYTRDHLSVLVPREGPLTGTVCFSPLDETGSEIPGQRICRAFSGLGLPRVRFVGDSQPPGDHDFGALPVGQGAVRRYELKNFSSYPVTGAITLPEPFRTPAGEPTVPVDIANGYRSMELEVMFAAEAEGAWSGSLAIDLEGLGERYTWQLDGRAVEPALTGPDSHAFGTVPLSTHRTVSIPFTNPTEVPVRARASLAGPFHEPAATGEGTWATAAGPAELRFRAASITTRGIGGGCTDCVDWTTTATAAAYVGEDLDPRITVEDAGATLRVAGNSWRRTAETFTLTQASILEFDFRAGEEGEIHGIGFDENGSIDDASRIYQLFGTEACAVCIPITGYSAADVGTWKRFVIPVGDLYTGRDMALVLVTDNDADRSGVDSAFRDVRLIEGIVTENRSGFVEVPPHSTADLELTFEPTFPGALLYRARLDFEHAPPPVDLGLAQPLHSMTVTGSTTAPIPPGEPWGPEGPVTLLHADTGLVATTWDAGTVSVLDSASHTFRLRNNRLTTLHGSVAGPPPLRWGSQFSVPPGGEADVEVFVDVDTAGPWSIPIDFMVGGFSHHRITISGRTPTDPIWVAPAGGLDFGSVEHGQVVRQRFLLTNNHPEAKVFHVYIPDTAEAQPLWHFLPPETSSPAFFSSHHVGAGATREIWLEYRPEAGDPAMSTTVQVIMWPADQAPDPPRYTPDPLRHDIVHALSVRGCSPGNCGPSGPGGPVSLHGGMGKGAPR